MTSRATVTEHMEKHFEKKKDELKGRLARLDKLTVLVQDCETWPIKRDEGGGFRRGVALKRQALKQSIHTEGEQKCCSIWEYEKNNVFLNGGQNRK